MTRCLVASLAALGLAMPSTVAEAQTPRELAAAKQAFKEGDEAEQRSDFPTALARFKAALAIKATPQLHLRVGAVEERLGQLVDALGSYERGLEKASSLPAVAKLAKEQIDALRPRIPTLTLVAPRSYPNLEVTLDGAPIASSALGTALRVDPGSHKLHAAASGYVSRDQVIASVERNGTRVEIDLAVVGPALPLAAPRPSKLPGALVVGGGGAALVAGAVLLGVSFAKDGAINDLCGGPARLTCPRSQQTQIESDVSTVNAMRFSGIGVAALGAAGAAVGTYLLVKASRQGPTTGTVQVVPVMGAGTAGVVALGRF